MLATGSEGKSKAEKYALAEVLLLPAGSIDA